MIPPIFYTVWPYLLAVLHAVIIVVASAHVILTKRDHRAAIGWVGIIWLTPFLGALLYYTFGVNRIQRRAQTLMSRRDRPGKSTTSQHAPAEQVRQTLGDDHRTLAPLVEFVGKVIHLPLLAGNQITPLLDGDTAYGEMLAAIDAAQHSVVLETYIFDNDALGRRFCEALARAVERGVDVRVLIDDVGTRYSWPSIKARLRSAQVPFAIFLPTLIPWEFHYSNLRNHRKIMVVDGQVGFTGGMNIRRGHLHTDPGPHPIQDLHFRVTGPVVANLAETAAFDWQFCTGEHLVGPEWFPPLKPCGESLARGIADGPDIDFDKLRLTLLGAISCAQRSIHIITPYYLPDQTLITALNVAAMRGVSVHLLIPKKNNLWLVQWACMAQLWQVLQRGCHVWLTPPPFDHTKLMLVDEVWTFLGSANWDSRSLRLNFEFNLECYDRPLAAQLGALIRQKISQAEPITLSDVDGRPLWMRLRDGVARLATPYL